MTPLLSLAERQATRGPDASTVSHVHDGGGPDGGPLPRALRRFKRRSGVCMPLRFEIGNEGWKFLVGEPATASPRSRGDHLA